VNFGVEPVEKGQMIDKLRAFWAILLYYGYTLRGVTPLNFSTKNYRGKI
jgi:hypothetical protein